MRILLHFNNAFYTHLKEVCNSYNIIICPKVRLEDFIETTDRENKMKYRGYIKSRHIDFLLCNSGLHIIAAVELDDSTHNSMSARETDIMKNNIFKTIGIPLYRIKTGTDYKYEIKKMIEGLQNTI